MFHHSAAFDTVDHDLLMLRLERQFGIHGVALEWLRSCIHGRSYRVIYGGSMSAMVYVVFCGAGISSWSASLHRVHGGFIRSFQET